MAGPTVRFLGGVREIGGNKILIEDRSDRILFDFGPAFDPKYEEFFIDYLQPRSTSPIKDLLEFDLIPWIDGLYSKEALAGIEDRYRPPEVGAVFVSHAHFDHAGYLKHLDPEIPVHVGRGTRTLMDAIETSTTTKYGERSWRVFDPGSSIRVGGLEVVPLPVDHSIPHAFGFLIRTRAGTVVYTGDFRRHGPRAALTTEFLRSAAREEPRLLIIEGTRAGPDPRKNFTEQGVREGVDHVLAKTSDLAIATCYPRDVDRLGTLHRAAADAGRDLVIPFRAAHLLTSLEGDPTLAPPLPGKSKHLKVYQRPKKVYYKWERPFIDDSVDADWVHRHGREALLLLDMNQFTELIDLRPPRGTPFIRSMSEPFSEEDVSEAVLQNWLGHFGLGLEQFHASGHCSGPELMEVIGELNPGRVFPIHTEHPEAFEGSTSAVVPPEKGLRYDVDTGRKVT
ncbi:MAG TPA: MBL fold metallo-hydrolase [Thermoplasmata archaeon]|nr:MBL fold metallo-hydrolase [Thermoplasmata archaeon]